MHSMQQTFLFEDYKKPVMNSAETWLNTFLTSLESWILGFVEGAGNQGSDSSGSVLCSDSLTNAIKEVFALKSYLRVYQLSTAITLSAKVNNATQQVNLCYTYCNFNAYLNRLGNAFSHPGSGDNITNVFNTTNKVIAEKLKLIPKKP